MGRRDRLGRWLARRRATVRDARSTLAEEIYMEADRLRFGSLSGHGTVLADVRQAAREAHEIAEYVKGTQLDHDLHLFSEVLVLYKTGLFPPLSAGAEAVLDKRSSGTSSGTFAPALKFEAIVGTLRRDLEADEKRSDAPSRDF